MVNSLPKKKINQKTLDLITEAANEEIQDVLSELGIDIDVIRGINEEIRCPCPVHEGDGPTAFSYNTKYKNWRCYSNKCHEGNDNIFGLTRLLLSKAKGEDVNFREAVVWLGKLLGIAVEEENEIVDPEHLEIVNTIKQAKAKRNIKTREKPNLKESKEFPFPLSTIEGKIVPSQYFLDQGFSEEILKKYYVGYCSNPRKPMYLRSYTPVLDEKGTNVLGVTGRIIYEKCQFCPSFHAQGKGCPKDNPNIRGYSKWQHYGFNTGSVVYNIWYAAKHIKESGIAIITEGPKDVWWLEQHGIHNSICVFGLNVLDYHLNTLLKNGTMKVVVALDNDEKGLEAAELIDSKFGDYFKLININNLLSYGDDIADVSSERMYKEIVPFIKQLENTNGK